MAQERSRDGYHMRLNGVLDWSRLVPPLQLWSLVPLGLKGEVVKQACTRGSNPRNIDPFSSPQTFVLARLPCWNNVETLTCLIRMLEQRRPVAQTHAHLHLVFVGEDTLPVWFDRHSQKNKTTHTHARTHGHIAAKSSVASPQVSAPERVSKPTGEGREGMVAFVLCRDERRCHACGGPSNVGL